MVLCGKGALARSGVQINPGWRLDSKGPCFRRSMFKNGACGESFLIKPELRVHARTQWQGVLT